MGRITYPSTDCSTDCGTDCSTDCSTNSSTDCSTDCLQLQGHVQFQLQGHVLAEKVTTMQIVSLSAWHMFQRY